jgi:hypothetical protein
MAEGEGLTKPFCPYRLKKYLKVVMMNVLIILTAMTMVMIMAMRRGMKSPALILDVIRVKKDH